MQAGRAQVIDIATHKQLNLPMTRRLAGDAVMRDHVALVARRFTGSNRLQAQIEMLQHGLKESHERRIRRIEMALGISPEGYRAAA